jgi:uncharacterized protein (UPF0212 family)
VLQAAWVVLKVALYADDEAEAARRQLQRLNEPTAHAVEEVGSRSCMDACMHACESRVFRSFVSVFDRRKRGVAGAGPAESMCKR